MLLWLLWLSLPVMAKDTYTEIMIVEDQVETPAPKCDTEEQVFYTAEVMPEFPGGMRGLMEWLCDNLRYPADARDDKIEGKVAVMFVVDKNGNVRNPKIVRGKHPSLNAEALRVVKELPRFAPGTVNGQPVNVWYTLPIIFSLNTL